MFWRALEFNGLYSIYILWGNLVSKQHTGGGALLAITDSIILLYITIRSDSEYKVGAGTDALLSAHIDEVITFTSIACNAQSC